MKVNGKIHGLLGEFQNPAHLLQAAAEVRKAGYKKFDCHSPFPIHGMDDAMGLKRSKLGFVVAFFGLIGAIAGLSLQGWTSTIAYPVVVSGKPLFSWQAFIIITFAFFVIFGTFSAVLGMLHFNRLPRYYHPVFYSDNFKKFSDDGFFISIEVDDPYFDPEKSLKFLESLGAQNVELLQGE